MANNNSGAIKVKGGLTCRDFLVDKETEIGQSLRKARKTNKAIDNMALDIEIKTIEMAMRRRE